MTCTFNSSNKNKKLKWETEELPLRGNMNNNNHSTSKAHTSFNIIIQHPIKELHRLWAIWYAMIEQVPEFYIEKERHA